MRDQTGREIDYMRISITDRCNLRCKYCMPDGIQCMPRWEILSLEELEAIAVCAADLGIRKIKVTGGSFDSSKGEFRLCGVTAGVGGCSYMSYPKVPAKVEELCSILREKQKNMETFRERYELSFNAHLNLVTVHPWVDGNGRTARLLMNYIQFCHHLFPTKIFKEDRGDYILSLRQSQEDENSQPFLDFMAAQLKKSFASEIEKYNTGRKKGFNLMF